MLNITRVARMELAESGATEVRLSRIPLRFIRATGYLLTSRQGDAAEKRSAKPPNPIKSRLSDANGRRVHLAAELGQEIIPKAECVQEKTT